MVHCSDTFNNVLISEYQLEVKICIENLSDPKQIFSYVMLHAVLGKCYLGQRIMMCIDPTCTL